MSADSYATFLAQRDDLRLWMDADREDVLRKRLAGYNVKAVSPCGLRCADLLEQWLGGLHHWPTRGGVAKTDWSDFYVRFLGHRHMASFDWGNLTALVFLAHDLAIRVEVDSCNMQCVEIMLHPRTRQRGDGFARHPTLDEAVAAWRSRNPIYVPTANAGDVPAAGVPT